MIKALSGRTNSHNIKWDVSDFPLVCEKCIGENPYIKMSKANFDLECKMCIRPFDVFRWKTQGKFKRTEICLTCAKVKNLCQSCLLDLNFGLQMELRDDFLKEKVQMPKDITNRDYWSYKISKKIDSMNLPYNDFSNYRVLDNFNDNKTRSNNTNEGNYTNFNPIKSNQNEYNQVEAEEKCLIINDSFIKESDLMILSEETIEKFLLDSDYRGKKEVKEVKSQEINEEINEEVEKVEEIKESKDSSKINSNSNFN